MIRKENIKIYLKEKQTKIAFSFFVIFLVIFLISLMPFASRVKGVRNNFKYEKIEQIYSNNYNTTYIVSNKNHLFFSFNKDYKSHLNDYANIKDISNEYGDGQSHLYNFIYLDYEFPSKIKDVIGFSDDFEGEKGYTLVLLENGDLYHLSTDQNKFAIILHNVNRIKTTFKNLLIEDNNHNLYYYYLYDNYLLKINLNINNPKDYFFSQKIVEDSQSVLQAYVAYGNNNYLNKLSFEISEKTFININKENATEEQKLDTNNIFLDDMEEDSSLRYKIYNTTSVINEEQLMINNVTQIESIDNTALIVANNKLYGIDNVDHRFSNEEITEINFDYSIDKLYTSGEFAYLIKSNDSYYYLGNIKIDEDISYTEFKKYEIDKNIDELYFSTNISFYIKNQNIYIYNKETKKYETMYESFFIKYIVKYFSLFVVVMILFYFVVSFLELNARYNRYFSSRKDK